MTLGYYGDNDSYALGVVEDVNDPLRAGRVRVRVHGLHSDDADELPFTDLPWSQVLMPVTEAGVSGVGQAPLGLKVGSLVYCRFLDGESKQQLLVMGSLPGISEYTEVQGQIYGPDELRGASTAEQIYEFFIGRGYTQAQAAGILGAILAFVGNDLSTGENKDGFGLGLWKAEDLKAFRAFAAERQKGDTDLATQLLYIHEGLAKTTWPNVVAKRGFDSTIRSGETVEDFSDSFVQAYYRRSTKAGLAARRRLTKQAYEAYAVRGPDRGSLPPAKATPLTGLGSIIETREALRAELQACRRTIKELIVHHTDTYENMQTDAFDVDGWHRARGFSGIGYHFLILRDGRLQVGRPLGQAGEHARGRNTGTVGIAFVGGRKGHLSTRKIINSSETFTDAQWRTFNDFVLTFLEVFPNSSTIGHSDVQNDRTDPNFDVRAYVANLMGYRVAEERPKPAAPTVGQKTVAIEPSKPKAKLEPALDPTEPVVPPEPTVSYPAKVASGLVPASTVVPRLSVGPIKLPTIPSPFSSPIQSILGAGTPILPDGVLTLNALAPLLGNFVTNTSLTTLLGSLTLGGLFDVDLSGAVDGQVLTYQGGEWVPTTPGGGGSVDWDAITGKPSTFPPSAHTHDIVDVTGLQTALDGKAALGHTHSAADITSGTLADALVAASSVTQHQAALSIAWGQLTGVPSTFTPSAHTHAITDVTGLQTALDGKLNASAYTAADVLSKLLTVDGSGSSLDADLLDGQHGSYYLAWGNLTGVPSTFTPSAHTHDAGDITTGLIAAARLGTGTANGTTFLRGDGSWATPSTGSSFDTSANYTVTGSWNFGDNLVLNQSVSGIAQLQFNRSAAGTDLKRWDIIDYDGTLRIRTINDAGSSANDFVRFSRSGVTAVSATFPATIIGNSGQRIGGGYQAGVIGYSDGNWGFINRPPLAGAIAAHRWDSFDGTERLRLSEAGVLTVPGVLNISDAPANDRVSINFSSGLRIFNKDNTPIFFGTANTERARIDASGRLGINLTDSNARLGVLQTGTDVIGQAAGAAATCIEVRGNGGAAAMTFHRPGVFAAYFGIDNDNRFKVGGWSFGSASYPVALLEKSDQTGTIYLDNWYRSYGDTGWYNETYGGGIYMADTTWVRTYNNKNFYTAGDIVSSNNIIAYYSDERLKTRLGKIDKALERIRKLDGFFYVNNELAKKFGYKSKKIQVGLSAQQLMEVLPEVVTLAPFDMQTHQTSGKISSKSGQNYMTVFYEKVVPLLVEGIKELEDKVQDLTEKLTLALNRLEALENR